jgi:dihydrofolate reductase
MGRIIVSVALSLDGFAEGAAGDLSAMPLDEGFNVHNAERIEAADAVMYGGTTFRMMVGYWPQVPANPAASPAEQRVAAKLAAGMPVVVVSDSVTEDETGPWREQATIVRRAGIAAAIAELRARPGDTVVFGSQTLWTALLADGLVDELYVLVGPRIVAGDAPAFAGEPRTDLRLVDAGRLDGSQLVALHYTVER